MLIFRTQRACTWLLVAAAAGVPSLLSVAPTAGQALRLAETHGLFNTQAVLRLVLFIGIGALLFLMLLTWRRRKQKHCDRLFVMARGTTLLSLFYIYCLLASFITLSNLQLIISVYKVYEWFVVIILVHLVFLQRYSIFEERDATADLAYTVKAIALVLLCYVFVGMMFGIERDVRYGDVFRLGGAVHPQLLGCMSALAALACLRSGAPHRDKYFAAVFVGAMLAAYSRTAILGFVVSLALLKLCTRHDIKAILVWSACVLLVALTLLLGDTYGEFLVSFFSRGQSIQAVETLNSRTFVWTAALRMISDSPWVGHGFGVGVKSIRYYAEVFQPLHAHNDVLNAAVDTGIFGAALLILAYMVFLMTAVGRAWRDPRYALPASLGTFVFIYSLTEPVLAREVLAPGVVLVACVQVVSVLSAQRRIARSQGLTLQDQRSASARTSGVGMLARRARPASGTGDPWRSS